MTNCSVLWWKEYGEKALYSLGTDGKRYFSSWSESRWPRQDEDGRDLVPAENIDDGWNGIAWFDTFDQAMQDMVGSSRPSGWERIETKSIGPTSRITFVAPGLRAGRGLKQVIR